jgi:hypothetical protein
MKKYLLSLVTVAVLFAASDTICAVHAADSSAGQQKPAELDRAIRVTMKYLELKP